MAERKPYLFDNPRNIKLVIYALYAIVRRAGAA
jgi:hypothetical protein